MKAIDIEQLVRWAYREELPKRDTVSSGAGTSWMVTGVRGTGTGLPPPAHHQWMGEAHSDAIEVEAAVGRLRDLAMDWADLRRLTLGAAGGALRFRDKTLPDGRTVLHPLDACLATLSMRPAALIVMHGRAATRPHCTDIPRIKRLRHELNGKVKVWRVDPDTGEQLFYRHPKTGIMTAEAAYDSHQRMRKGAACPVEYEPTHAQVARDRAEYLIWLAGLEVLAADLVGRLANHDPLPPAAPRRPWATMAASLLQAA
ncbi:hypothetical protein [Labrys wisconsinensis]|uniref:Uncharacterized protein n=1 Tax=Labrys wisconsinensis TaxID=425677 RepID=A0ABU0JH45_9HYPH|nr:hypothetical protein [Labrys wisconsinensis]MDQ0472801.1 hypothetical protein [Labrys wisconsinensis]